MLKRKIFAVLALIAILAVASMVIIPGALCSDIKTTRSSTITLAAYNSSELSRAQADYVCMGNKDEIKIQQAIDNLPASGGSVAFLEGRYLISSPIIFRVRSGNGGITVKGQGIGNTTIQNFTANGTDAIQIGTGAQAGSMYFFDMSDMSILGNSQTGNGIYINNRLSCKMISFHDLEIRGHGGWGITPYMSFPIQGLYMRDLWVEGNSLGGIRTWGYGWSLTGVRSWNNLGYGIDCQGMNMMLDGVNNEGNEWGVRLAHGYVVNSFFSDNKKGDIWIYGANGYTRIINNFFGSHKANETLLKVQEAYNYIGVNNFVSLEAGVIGIELIAGYNRVDTQIWSEYNNDPTARKIVNRNSTNNVTIQ